MKMDYQKESLRLHGEWKGKIEVVPTVSVENKDDLSLAYTPGVAQPCLEIQKNHDKSYELTRRHNLCAVITDGSAVLGLGDIGPEAGMPVMEGKCVLFKTFGGVDAFPLCIKTKDVDKFVNTVYLVSGSFGGINLEDISAPRCFEIERKLKEKCDIPVFHDDQHGTAVITLAGLINALKVVGKKKEDVKIVVSGAGAAAISIVKLLLSAGFKDITMCDRKGAVYEGREGLNWIKEEIAKDTNLNRSEGTLAKQLVGADVFIGVSAPGIVTKDMVQTMNQDAIIFACESRRAHLFGTQHTGAFLQFAPQILLFYFASKYSCRVHNCINQRNVSCTSANISVFLEPVSYFLPCRVYILVKQSFCRYNESRCAESTLRTAVNHPGQLQRVKVLMGTYAFNCNDL
jgi:malate dehydrogenase (oxaloacetate-decarboxylating)